MCIKNLILDYIFYQVCVYVFQCQCQCQSKIVSVSKIAKQLQRPRGRSVIKGQCHEKAGEKEMF